MPGFDQHTKEKIQQWDALQKEAIEIELFETHSEEGKQFTNYAKQITQLAPHLTIQHKTNETIGLPSFLLVENIQYSALALEKELEPFLEGLSQIKGHGPILSQELKESLDQIDIPVTLKLYIALQCPHCPGVVRTVLPMAFHCKNIKLHIIDGTLFPQAAQKDSVMAAPCLILDDDFRWTGSISAQEIVKMILNRDVSQLGPGTLKNILEQGDASWITEQIIKAGKIFDGFVKLILHETWSVRLGAIVIVEELAEKKPELALMLCPLLFDEFDQKDVTIQGDILYALGEAGDLHTKEQITRILAHLDNEHLIDEAKDAIESIESRN